MSKGVDDTVFCRQVMVAVPIQIHISMGWFSEDSCRNWSIWLWYDQTVQKGIDPSGLESLMWIGSWGQCCWCAGKIHFCLQNSRWHKCHLHTSSTFWRILGSLNGFNFKVLHEEVGHYGADGWPHGYSIDLHWLEVTVVTHLGCAITSALTISL